MEREKFIEILIADLLDKYKNFENVTDKGDGLIIVKYFDGSEWNINITAH